MVEYCYHSHLHYMAVETFAESLVLPAKEPREQPNVIKTGREKVVTQRLFCNTRNDEHTSTTGVETRIET